MSERDRIDAADLLNRIRDVSDPAIRCTLRSAMNHVAGTGALRRRCYQGILRIIEALDTPRPEPQSEAGAGEGEACCLWPGTNRCCQNQRGRDSEPLNIRCSKCYHDDVHVRYRKEGERRDSVAQRASYGPEAKEGCFDLSCRTCGFQWTEPVRTDPEPTPEGSYPAMVVEDPIPATPYVDDDGGRDRDARWNHRPTPETRAGEEVLPERLADNIPDETFADWLEWYAENVCDEIRHEVRLREAAHRLRRYTAPKWQEGEISDAALVEHLECIASLQHTLDHHDILIAAARRLDAQRGERGIQEELYRAYVLGRDEASNGDPCRGRSDFSTVSRRLASEGVQAGPVAWMVECCDDCGPGFEKERPGTGDDMQCSFCGATPETFDVTPLYRRPSSAGGEGVGSGGGADE